METANPTAVQYADVGGFVRAVTRMVRFRRRAKNGGGGPAVGMVSEDGSVAKVKLPECFDLDGVSLPSRSDCFLEDEKRRLQQLRDREAAEALLAGLFASLSAVKAAYAQLQTAQSPYDPDTIQSADQVVVAELKQLSLLKQSYYSKQIHGGGRARESLILAEVQEQRNLIKAFQIAAKKMEGDLHGKDAEILRLTEQLAGSEKSNKAMEAKVMLDGSAPSAAHFLGVLRYTVKSTRAFAKVMAAAMERAGWDLDAAAASIERGVVCRSTEHRAFVFESYVCRMMFSGFQHPKFAAGDQLSGGTPPDRRRFFDEFAELKFGKLKPLLDGRSTASDFPEFCRAKYLELVHPRMEESFFGNLEHRGLLRTAGGGFPETEFFLGFAEMARRVWLLHRLFFSFDPESQEEAASIFEARKGGRFSEVYMASVAELEGAASPEGGTGPVVGFTVVPGFQVGKTVIRCRVYLAAAGEGSGGEAG